jgi:hypothetical protein
MAFFFFNTLLTLFLYLYIFKKKTLIGFQLGMSISMATSGMVALLSGIIFMYHFPFSYTENTIAAACIGMITGIVFGLLFDYQTMLTGFVNGLMIGIMAPMVGAAAEFHTNFLLFTEGLFIGVLFLLIFSVQYSS